MIAAETVAIIFLCLYVPAVIPLTAAFTVTWALNIVAVTVIATGNGGPETNCAAILIVVALPVAGALVLLISRLNRRICGDLSVFCSKTGEKVTSVGYDRAEYFECGEQFFLKLFNEIASAKKYVYLEYFIVCRGHILNGLLTALATAKARGADIRMIVDGVGCAFKLKRKDIKRIKSVAKLKIFNRLTPFFDARLNNRDHRKIAVIDGRVAFTGGFNIADEYANIDSPFGYWKDTGVMVRGGAAKVFEGMFLSVWNKKHCLEIEPRGKCGCEPYYDSPTVNAGECEDRYMAAICAAKDSVSVFTPYFCPGEKLTAALCSAAKNGVKVRVVLPRIPDKKYAYELSLHYAQQLMGRGVSFYLYTPGFMHAKSVICDNELYIGSYNFDYRSMRLNYECGVKLSGEACERAKADFEKCVELSAPLVRETPPRKRRAYRFLLKLFAPLF